jgi:hypothetical protein
MHSPTAHAASFAQHLTKELGVILGDDLVGVYLHGTGATACFQPRSQRH